MKSAKILLATALITLISACSQNTPTTSTTSSTAVDSRQMLMKEWRAANETLKGMTENPANFDAAVVKEKAQHFVDTAPTMWTHFADSNDKGDAQDAVWSDAAGFKAKADEFTAAANALNTAAANATQLSDVEAQMNALGESCGSCHKVYKK